jgi:hypothetical protein
MYLFKMIKIFTLRRVAILALLVIAIFPVSYVYRLHNVESVFWSASKNMLRTEIENSLGKPDSVDSCGENLWWGGDQSNPPKNNGECAFWVRYNFFLEAYAFGYSSTGHLTSKYRYFSE